MMQLTLEMLPFAVFVAIGIYAFAEQPSQRTATVTTRFPRPRTFCGFRDGETLVLADPDGKPVTRSR